MGRRLGDSCESMFRKNVARLVVNAIAQVAAMLARGKQTYAERFVFVRRQAAYLFGRLFKHADERIEIAFILVGNIIAKLKFRRPASELALNAKHLA